MGDIGVNRMTVEMCVYKKHLQPLSYMNVSAFVDVSGTIDRVGKITPVLEATDP